MFFDAVLKIGRLVLTYQQQINIYQLYSDTGYRLEDSLNVIDREG